MATQHSESLSTGPEGMRILLIQAQPEPELTRALAREGRDVLALAADERPVRFLRVFKPHVVLIAIPDASATCRELRRESPQVPIVAILAGHDIEEMIAVLESGADDCVPLSVQQAELGARIQAVRRRAFRGSCRSAAPSNC